MSRLFNIFCLSSLVASGVGHAELILTPALSNRTLLIRQRSFAPGAPAGWTQTPFAGTAGATLVNAQPAAIQASLRLVDMDSTDIYPVEPRLTVRGPESVYASATQRLDAERADLARARTAAAAEDRALDAEMQRQVADLKLLNARRDSLSQTFRVVARELMRHPDNYDARAQSAELDRELGQIGTATFRAEHARRELTETRERRRHATEEEFKARAARLDAERAVLAGFYVAEPSSKGTACAKPWVYRAAPDQDVNPFYPGTALSGPIGDVRLLVCASEGRVHATYLTTADGRTLLTALYGRTPQGQVNRIVIREPKGREAYGSLIEDHQFLPGPGQGIRYGLTFREASGALVSVYTDLGPI